jgi:hypothetical protein
VRASTVIYPVQAKCAREKRKVPCDYLKAPLHAQNVGHVFVQVCPRDHHPHVILSVLSMDRILDNPSFLSCPLPAPNELSLCNYAEKNRRMAITARTPAYSSFEQQQANVIFFIRGVLRWPVSNAREFRAVFA